MGLDEKFRRIHNEEGIINDRWLFMDKDKYNDADYLREIGANDIELLKLLKEKISPAFNLKLIVNLLS